MAPRDKESLLEALEGLSVKDPKREERAEKARREHEDAMVHAAIRWLAEKWGSEDHEARCPYCGHDGFAVAPPIETHPFGRFNVIKAFIPVICMNCAQTTFLDAERSTGFPIPNDFERAPEEGDE